MPHEYRQFNVLVLQSLNVHDSTVFIIKPKYFDESHFLSYVLKCIRSISGLCSSY